VARRDPYKNFRFRVEIEGVVVAGFSEVAIAEESAGAAIGGNRRKRPGPTRFANIMLKRGVADRDRVAPLLGGKPDRGKTIVIRIADELGTETGRWMVSGAWPAKLESPQFNAKGNEVVIELLELANEGIERIC